MSDAAFLGLVRESLFEVAPARKADFAKIELDTRIDALGLGSIEVMEMVTGVEDRLGIILPEDELQRVQSLRDLSKVVVGAGGVVQ